MLKKLTTILFLILAGVQMALAGVVKGIVTDAATIYIPMSEMVDTEKERARLEAELKKLTDEIDRVNKKLANESFVAKAPAAVVDAERAKLQKYTENLNGVKAALEKLK